MKQFPGITPPELEYRAKLVELHYSNDLGLLQKFLTEADGIKTSALELLHTDTKEMEKKYSVRP